MKRNKAAVGLKHAIMPYRCHSSTNCHPTVMALNARSRLHSYKQEGDQLVQDYVKEIRSLAEAVKEVDRG